MKITWDMDALVDFGLRVSEYENFQTAIMTATKEIAKVLHGHLLQNTPVKTGNLRKMWSANENLLFTVEEKNGGYEVTFLNKARNLNGTTLDAARASESEGFMYGWIVNYSPKSRHQFFVEKSVIMSEPQLRKCVMQELQKWFRWCVNGN